MMISLSELNAPRAYPEVLWKLRVYGKDQQSRNGPVISMVEPFLLTIWNPTERVLFDPIRDANPFFHVMEFCWMMAGSNNAKWLSQFNKRMLEYADDGILRGAYGWRWQNPGDQIADVISLLRRDSHTRQAVLSMWDPLYDNSAAKTSDRPCNTHIYFRVNEANELTMTVCNRSNDAIWGMLGANIVHMTFLQELVALASGLQVGDYHIFTNNLHIYRGMPRFHEIYHSSATYDYYEHGVVSPYPLLQDGEDWRDLRYDCERLLVGQEVDFDTRWMNDVAAPMYRAYLDKASRDGHIKEIVATDWRLACEQWSERRKNNTSGFSGDEVSHVSAAEG